MNLDFQYLPLAYTEGEERSDFPGYLVQSAPRSAHRHRRSDLLALVLKLDGKHGYSKDEIDLLTDQAAALFFNTQGSVTRAQQEMTDWVNNQLFERNMDRGYEGIRAVGSLNTAVLHKGQLFISQFGHAGAHLIRPDVFEEFGINEGKTESLGQSKHIQTRFFQAEVSDKDLLLMSADPPDAWTGYAFTGIGKLTVGQLKRRLLNQVSDSLEALVIRFEKGAGHVIKKSWGTTQNPDVSEIIKELKIPVISDDLNEKKQHAQLKEDEEKAVETVSSPESSKQTDSMKMESDLQARTIQVTPGETARPAADKTEEENAPLTTNDAAPKWLIWLARQWMNMKTTRAKMRLFFSNLFSKFENSSGTKLQYSPILLTFLAAAIPIVIILSSWVVYQRTGKTQQFEIYLKQAQEEADLAKAESDLMAEYEHWAKAFEYIILAESYDINSDSRALFEQAQYRIDEMDLAARLDFRPALTDFFPEGVVICRIQASSSGVYLLDATSGSIIRIFLNSKGFYEIDNEFQCLPGPYGLVNVTNLVDFVTLPANDENYKIMAVDAQGNLLYCRPGKLPDSRTLSAPTSGWGQIIGITYGHNLLYVLDSVNESAWLFEGKDPARLTVEGASGIVFSESPIPFFDEEIPDLKGAIDLVINQEDLYILHADGQMSNCLYSPNKNLHLTSCEDPMPYTDNRVGRDTKKPWIFMDASFSMMEQAASPNASLFILDQASSGIYQFSLQLNLERTLKIQPNRSYPVPDKPPSGFGLSTDLEMFLAFDNQLFIAPLR